jgi:hypothetical protein
MIGSMALGLLAYVSVTGFMLVYLAMHKPGFLFNASDFDKSVQPMLFGAPPVIVQDVPAQNPQA